PFFLGLMRHLADNGVRCPVPIPREDGGILGELAGRPAAIVSYLEGMWPRRPTAEHCRAVGVALAGMHIAGQEFHIRRRNALTIDAWRPLWENSRGRAEEVETGLVAEAEADLDFLE